MAGFLDMIAGSGPDDPRSQAADQMIYGLLSGNFAGGLLGAGNVFAGAKDRQLKRGLLEMQAENYKSEIEQRKAAMAKQQQIQDAVAGLLGGSKPAPAAPGQMGSGSFGVIPAPAGQPDMPQPRGGLSGASLEQIAGLHAIGGPNLMDAYKFARQGIERKPGSFYEDMQGRRTFIPDVKSGMDFRDGKITQIPGYGPFLTQSTIAQEAPKALLAAAGKVNLRKNPDGTESPVSELSENPVLQDVLRQMSGGDAPIAPQQPVRPSASPASAARIPPEVQKERDAESIRMIQAEINAERNPQTRAALQRELDRMTASQSQPGFPTATLKVSPGVGYGKTTAQQIDEETEKARSVKQAEADVMPDQQRKAAISSADYMTGVLDMALKHPGLPTATGMQGTLDPRNYLPGTDATNFRVVLDQIKGSAFMQAYQNLKGGGQITEVEGKKATDAIARLNSAQSTPEFVKALKEFKEVIDAGRSRLVGTGQGPRGWSIQRVN